MATTSKRLLLKDIVAIDKIDQVPSNYIRPITQRPNLQDVLHDSIPVIDLQNLHGPDRYHVLDEIRRACREHGFFQVTNHGVPESTMANMMQLAKDFFNLPEAERLKLYSDDLNQIIRLSTSFNIRNEKVAIWRDFLGVPCNPLEDHVHEWPTNPASFQDHGAEYARYARVLALELMEAVSESLGLDKDYINRQLGTHNQLMVMNYYPQCPQPDLTYGLPPHTDHYALTILLHDEVPGLQVLKNNQWVAVDPVPNTLIVNVGDQIQVISNDKYKSGWHRAVVNCDKERISVPTFFSPSPDKVIGPAPELVTDDEPAVYRQFTYKEYDDSVWNNKLDKNCLDMFMLARG